MALFPLMLAMPGQHVPAWNITLLKSMALGKNHHHDIGQNHAQDTQNDAGNGHPPGADQAGGISQGVRGVLMGRLMPREEAKATDTSRAVTPPMGARLSPMLTPTTAIIGMSREAVAVWLMKVAMNRQMIPVPTMSGKGDHSAKGMEPIRFLPVRCLAGPAPGQSRRLPARARPSPFSSSLPW